MSPRSTQENPAPGGNQPVRIEVICNSAVVERLDKDGESRKSRVAREHLKNPPTASAYLCWEASSG